MKGIYKITNLINNHLYIGKTNNSERRWKDHQRLAFTKGHKEYNKTLYKAMRKYGLDNFTFEIIEEIEDNYDEISSIREKYWIDFYNAYHNGYNENLGGDGGSLKGHCRGSQNGRAKLTEEDVIKIRTIFKEGSSKKDCYELFKDKITESGFARVWLGKTWTHIMPEVYTKENIERNAKLGKGQSGIQHRLCDNETILQIRQRKINGETFGQVYKDYTNINKNTFQDIWLNKTYKELIINE